MDDDQQFCLRWNNHQSTLVSVFDTLLEKGIHVDCTLAAEGQTLKAHKVVLSACSPYFESVLSQQYDKHPIIILKDVKYAELRAMMDYMYRGEVNISQDQLAALLKAAESLQIKGLSDNKPSRPPSRPAPPAAAHPPRAPSPPPQARDGSIDSREGSVSPTRRRKKARRLSTEGLEVPVLNLPPANDNATGNGDEAHCKEEAPRDGVEDLTIDEEADDQPAVTHNDVVRNFQWHMERSQDEIMNSSDGVRDSQEPPLKLTGSLPYAKTPFPLTRGYLRKIDAREETKVEIKPRRGRKPLPNCLKKKYAIKKRGRTRKGESSNQSEKKFICSICHKKHYKYRRNKLRHEKYECVTGPQFACGVCQKKYSQKKTLTAHIALKHPDFVAKFEPEED
ncbi:zinc finger and BTB domain-containing protein 14-like isoform X3 [Hyposmocoma kahamanoa]|uniref:zinc finger and BTB domain-containing protein 14-like isoform X3 n=1 Tax=Hyposmocoma kahamanoa TaxID=1477025 RepID=UPI000E6D61D2|nr:zinc finger and BTB domain-containing protein 14-like isoform X3 [Hyposmocoma kahamanoa]